MKTKDGWDFEPGMTLYEVEDAYDGTMLLHTYKTNDWYPPSVKVDYDEHTSRGLWLEGLYADRQSATLELVRLHQECVEHHKNQIAALMGTL